MMTNAKIAGDIKVGDVVEFEVGSPVLVLEIEPNLPDDGLDTHPESTRDWGQSFIFGCTYTDESDGVNTFYVRRARSPISGPCVVR